MSEITAALGCSLIMVPILALAWYATSSGKSRRDWDEVDALRVEIAELRHQKADASGDELLGRR